MFLKRGKLGARQNFEGYDTGDEGLEEGAAEQSAVAELVSREAG